MSREPEGDPRLVVDVHEPAEIVAALRARDVPLVERKIHPGDYVVGELAIERKTIYDFWASLARQRLFEQVARLRETYDSCLLIVEGESQAVQAFSNPRAIHGAMASLALDFRVPILWTSGHAGTADLLAVLHRRERAAGRGTFVRSRPKATSPALAQRHLVMGLPGVGEVTAERLLSHFGSARAVFCATPRELARVPRVGERQAMAIAELLARPYSGRYGRLA